MFYTPNLRHVNAPMSTAILASAKELGEGSLVGILGRDVGGEKPLKELHKHNNLSPHRRVNSTILTK